MNKTIVFFLLGILALLAIIDYKGKRKETVRFEEKVYVAQDGTYVSHLNLYSKDLVALQKFAEPYDYGLRRNHIYIIVRDTSAIRHLQKKVTIMEIANSKFNIKPYVTR